MLNYNLKTPLKKNFVYKYKNPQTSEDFSCTIIEFIYGNDKLPLKDKFESVKILNIENNEEHIVNSNMLFLY